MRGLVGTLLVAAIVGMTACGETKPPGGSSTQAAAKQAAVQREKRERAAVAYSTCKSQLGPFIKQLKRLDSKLDIGMREADYSSEVANVNATYEELPFKELALPCLKAGVAAEKALKEDVRSDREWQTCIEDVECETSSIKHGLQKHWSVATVEIAQAEALLKAIRNA